ncbi:MAG: hypothetical protein GTO20_38920 [Candidatus Aminicenantes bacterium]|nr:hypothetical protein [Candidatus Aminicenantes bacterium]
MPDPYIYKLTETVCGEFDALESVIVMVPEYVPADNPEGSTETVTLFDPAPEAEMVGSGVLFPCHAGD